MKATTDLTVSELARLSGVTVRALHHYDDIGLLEPSRRSRAGYRLYSESDVERLAQVVALRATGMSLADVATALDGPPPSRQALLRRQLEILDRQATSLDRQRSLITRALEATDMAINLNQEDMREVFGDHNPGDFEEEAEARWGETDAYTESRRRTSSYTKEDWVNAKADADAAVEAFAACLAAGLPAESEQAMSAAEQHRASITRWYYDCSTEMQVGLAEMYIADPRFTAYYDDRVPGLAQYVHDAIVANALRD